MNKNVLFSSLIAPMAIALMSVYSYAAVNNTVDYKFDNFSYSLNDYNRKNYYNGFVSPVMHIKSSNTACDYQDLFLNYYYNNMVNGCRISVDDPFNVKEINNSTIRFLSQWTFSITDSTYRNTNNLYKLDFDQYYTYFSGDTLGKTSYLSPRFGSVSFVFITDTIADRLITKYGLDVNNKIESYKQIITNEKMCLLNVMGSNNQLANYQVSINNIIHTDTEYGMAKRTSSLFGDFALINVYGNLLTPFQRSFEIDLKVDPYGNKTIFKKVNSLGYGKDKTTFSFDSYDYTNGKYTVNTAANYEYRKILNNSDDATKPYLIFAICIFLLVGFLTFIWDKAIAVTDEIKKYSFWISLSLFAIYSIIATYIYIYPLWSITPIFGVVVLFIIDFKQITDPISAIMFNEYLKPLRKTNNIEKHEIEI